MSVLLPLTAFLVCVAAHLAARRVYPWLGLLDFPERYGLKRPRLPYPTGVLAVLAFLAFFPQLFQPGMQATGLGIGIILLGIACAIDDRRPLPPVLRLGIQAIAAFLIFATGTRIYTLTNPLDGFAGGEFIDLDNWVLPGGPFGPLPVLSGLFTMIWLLLTINALNWFDGIPGQVSTLSAIGFLTIGLLALSSRVNQPELALAAFTLSAIAAACLVADFPPPWVVMGDSGSMFFGLMLGTLTMYAGGKVATAFLVLGVPLIDSLIVVIRRVSAGRSPMKGSSSGEHLHHRLLAIGWSPRRIILLTAGLGSVFGVAALFLNTFEKFVAGALMVGIMLALSWYSQPSRNGKYDS